jgi:hypothetical protein
MEEYVMDNNALALTIKNNILANFPFADIEIIFDKELGEYFISTRNKELYYSEAYGMLIFEINQNILWKQGIFNFFFILDERDHEINKLSQDITVSLSDEVHYETAERQQELTHA